jgi:hypothetical protein
VVYTYNDFKNHVGTIELPGFELQEAIQGFLFVRRHADRTETIILGYRGYEPHGFRFYSPAADIAFEEVEVPLNRLLEIFAIEQRYGATTIRGRCKTDEPIDYGYRDVEINSRDTFDRVTGTLMKVLESQMLPFFEKYRNVADVCEALKTMSEDEISNFIVGIVGIKIPLLKKLSHAPDYRDELAKRLKFYSGEVFKYPEYFKDHDKVFKALFAEDIAAPQ